MEKCVDFYLETEMTLLLWNEENINDWSKTIFWCDIY